MDDQIWNLLEGGMGRGLGLEGQPVLEGGADLAAPGGHLPEDEGAGVHVDAEEGVAWEVDGALQHLGGHIASRTHLTIWAI